MMTKGSPTIIALVLVFLTTGVANAQFSSAIQGVVTDATGAAVPQATVTARNVATGVNREATTSVEGFYRISSLGPGTYTVAVQKTGFSVSQRDGLEVGISETARADLQLSVGSVTERVDVTAQALLVETEEGRVSGRVEQAQLRAMPMFGRNVLNLVALQPGVTGRGISAGMRSGGGNDVFSGETQPQVYASGQRWEANNYTVDDTSTNGVARNGATTLVPNEGSVEEVRVVANNFSAVDGRNPGAQVQIISRGGTNEIHGSLFYYGQYNALAARTVFESKLPVFRKHQYGYAVGGPIVRNRTFFFTTFEGLRQGGARATVYDVETKELADFVLRTRPNSIAAKVIAAFPPAFYPTYNFRDLGSPTAGINVWSSTPDGMADIGSVLFVPNVHRAGRQFSVRIDHELRPGKDRLYANYYDTKNDTLSASGIRPAFDRPVQEMTYFGNINHTHIFSSNMVNEFRAGVMELNGYPDQYKDRRQLLGIPNISITSVTGFGPGQFPNGWWQTNYQLKEILSKVRASQTLKMGFELRHSRGSAQNTTNYIPSYSFANVLDFVDDEPISMSRLVDPSTGDPVISWGQLKQTEWALFLQNDWKVTRSLTLNMGLRYENFGTFSMKEKQLRNIVFGPGNTYWDRLASAKVDFVPELNPTDNNNFGPRLGFAWDAGGRGRTVIRGGFGVAYDRMMNLPAESQRNNPPLKAPVNLGLLLGTPTFTYGMGDPSKPGLGFPVDAALKVGLDERNGVKGARATLQTVDPGIRSPYTQNWFFGVQQQVSRATVVEMNYLGSVANNLFNSINRNRYAGDLLDGKFNGINPSFGSINMVQTTSRSRYHGGTLTLKHRLRTDFTLQGAFTFGKAMNDTDNGVSTTAWQDAWSRRGEWGLAGYDVSRTLRVTGLWNMPFFKGRDSRSAVYQALGGWLLSGFAILDNGTPMTVTTAGTWPRGDWNGDNNGGDRPNAPTTTMKTSGWTRQELLGGIFRVADFPVPTLGTNGTLGRNTFRGPGFVEVDLSLAKTFTITERLKATFRLECYNALNRVNLDTPVTNLSNVNFGKSTSQLSPRQMQLGLKIDF